MMSDDVRERLMPYWDIEGEAVFEHWSLPVDPRTWLDNFVGPLETLPWNLEKRTFSDSENITSEMRRMESSPSFQSHFCVVCGNPAYVAAELWWNGSEYEEEDLT